MTALVPGIATQDAMHGHEASFDDAVLLNRLQTIFGAGGSKTTEAIREHVFHRSVIKRQSLLINFNHLGDKQARIILKGSENFSHINLDKNLIS